MLDCWMRLKLTDADNVKLEAPLDELLLNLLGDAVETDIALRVDRLLRCSVCGGHFGRLSTSKVQIRVRKGLEG